MATAMPMYCYSLPRRRTSDPDEYQCHDDCETLISALPSLVFCGGLARSSIGTCQQKHSLKAKSRVPCPSIVNIAVYEV